MYKSEYLIEKLKKWEHAPELSNYNLYELSYRNVDNEGVKHFFTVFNSLFFWHFENLNRAIRNRHYWAEDSRRLVEIIEEYFRIKSGLIGSDYQFELIEYYESIIQKCRDFLQLSGGSPLPEDFDKIDILMISLYLKL